MLNGPINEVLNIEIGDILVNERDYDYDYDYDY